MFRQFAASFEASIRNFLSKEREKSRTWKRGGRVTVLSLDGNAEGRYRDEPVDRLTPEDIFERRWALTLLERVLARLDGADRPVSRRRRNAHDAEEGR